MRILQFIDIPWDSGLAHYALTLSQGLKARGHRVFISALPGQKPWVRARRLGLKTVPLATLKGLTRLRRFLKDQKIQIVNAHTGNTHSLALAGALGQRVAVIRTRADARPPQRRLAARFLFRNTHRIIAAAEYIRDAYLKTLHLPPRKVSTVYQGLSLAEFRVHPIPASPTIGIVARLDPVKGHRFLLEALSILKDRYPSLRLRVVGQEENVKQHDLELLAARLGLAGHVAFLGFQKDIARIMAECAIGVVASTGSEAVSRAALEWMACGRPLVATHVGCLPELVQEGKTGVLVPPRDSRAIAHALDALLKDPERMRRMGLAARKRIEDNFTLSDFVAKTESVYRSALEEIGCPA